ncbi:MAG: recombination-associated protein RdgC [Desulfovibrio sp.]|nr:recombination-associated protein RdgC [Mailhella sp.]
MSFLKASSSFTRFRIIDEIPQETWESIPSKLRQFSFRDIDDIAEERSFGWTNFDDMLDTAWSVSPPEKADYLAFTLRLDTRRIPPAVMRKHVQLALRDELKRIKESGKNFIPRERKKELAEQVKLRLMGRFLPIPAEFQVIWNTVQGTVWLGSTQGKIIDMFLELFTRSFNIRLEQMLPYNLALAMLGNGFSEKLDALEATQFFA